MIYKEKPISTTLYKFTKPSLLRPTELTKQFIFSEFTKFVDIIKEAILLWFFLVIQPVIIILVTNIVLELCLRKHALEIKNVKISATIYYGFGCYCSVFEGLGFTFERVREGRIAF